MRVSMGDDGVDRSGTAARRERRRIRRSTRVVTVAVQLLSPLI